MRWSFPVCLITGFFCFHFIASAQDLHFNLIARPEEQSVGRILGMTQDVQGFLWLATETGLYKYDGAQYLVYNNETLNSNSPAANLIECITADKAGTIWFGPRLTGLDHFDPVTGVFTHYRHSDKDPGSLANDTVTAILEDHNGTLWVGTFGGLDKFDRKTNKFLHFQRKANDNASISCNIVRTIYEDKQGTIWVGTGEPFLTEGPVMKAA